MNPSYQHYATHDESEYPELWEGCVGAWAPCLGPSGTRLHDLSGGANWGNLTNMDQTTDWVVDDGQYALDFDGSNDSVAAGPNPAFDVGTGDFSISCWAKWPTYDGSSRIVVRCGFATNDAACGIYLSGPLLRGHFRNAAGIIREVQSPTPSANKWHHFLVYRQSQVVFFFVNAVLVGSVPDAGIDLSGNTSTRLGSNTPSGGFHYFGQLDDAMIFRRAPGVSAVRLLASRRGIAYTPRRRQKAYFLGPSFNAAWARGANQFIQPSMIGVA